MEGCPQLFRLCSGRPTAVHKAPTSFCHNFINVFIHNEKSCADAVQGSGQVEEILQEIGRTGDSLLSMFLRMLWGWGGGRQKAYSFVCS